jgi:hypothetical protein
MLRKSIVLIAMTLLATLGAQAQTSPKSFSFGLWGDMPYKKAGDDAKLPAVLKSINQSDIAFSLYDGDIKDGSSKCTDDVYTDALKMFATMVKPVVYVPGDNEWTDCHRTNNGGYDGLERLSYLRKVMFPSLNSLGQNTLTLEHQGKLGEKFVENTRFFHGGCLKILPRQHRAALGIPLCQHRFFRGSLQRLNNLRPAKFLYGLHGSVEPLETTMADGTLKNLFHWPALLTLSDQSKHGFQLAQIGLDHFLGMGQ